MIQPELFRALAYAWAAFGAYWMGASALKRPSSSGENSSRKGLRVLVLAAALALLFAGRHTIPAPLFIFLALGWSALGLFWTASGKSPRSGEFRFYRPLRLVILALTFSLLFWKQTAISFLARRFVPLSSALMIVAFGAALLGLLIAIWARVHLGRYWSDKVVLQEDHRLIRTGPYASMRHPIYSGVLLGVAGTAVVLGEVRGLIAFCILLLNYTIKARREEHILGQQFGHEFSLHRQRAGFLLPRLR